MTERDVDQPFEHTPRRAVLKSAAATGETQDDLLVTFTVDNAEFAVHGRGKVSDDGSKFVFTDGTFTAPRGANLSALGLAKRGTASGTVGLKSGAALALTLN